MSWRSLNAAVFDNNQATGSPLSYSRQVNAYAFGKRAWLISAIAVFARGK